MDASRGSMADQSRRAGNCALIANASVVTSGIGLVDVRLLLDAAFVVVIPGFAVDLLVPQQRAASQLLGSQFRLLLFQAVDELSGVGLVIGAAKEGHGAVLWRVMNTQCEAKGNQSVILAPVVFQEVFCPGKAADLLAERVVKTANIRMESHPEQPKAPAPR